MSRLLGAAIEAVIGFLNPLIQDGQIANEPTPRLHFTNTLVPNIPTESPPDYESAADIYSLANNNPLSTETVLTQHNITRQQIDPRLLPR